METNDRTVPDADDNEATAAFVRRNIAWMLRLARRYLSDAALAEDAVQSAFSNIFTKRHQFAGHSSIHGWMRRIVINEALMLLRKRRSMNEESGIDHLLPEFDENDCRIEELWSQPPTPEHLLMTEQTCQVVLDAIEALPDAYRVTLLLRDIEEHSTAEVAAELGISETNVKVRLHRARAALKSLLEPHMRKGGLL